MKKLILKMLGLAKTIENLQNKILYLNELLEVYDDIKRDVQINTDQISDLEYDVREHENQLNDFDFRIENLEE